MKLVKIYSNKESFQAIRFNPGFNVVLGEPKERKLKDKDTHNLGKSLLVDVIDFILLKDIKPEHLFKKHGNLFKDFIFYLEIKLNSRQYLVIRRDIEHASKISFKLNPYELEGFEKAMLWDHKNIPIKKAKDLLDEYLEFDVAPGWKYRKSISYFLRTRKDFRDVFQLAKYNKGNHMAWKPFLFEMLGFSGNAVLEKYELDKKKKELKSLISQVKETFSIGTGEADKIRGIIEVKSEDKNRIEKKIDDFDFYLQDKAVNQELVDEIDSKINTLNTIRYNITEEMNKINGSLQTDISQVDVEELQLLYKEVEIFFPENLVKEYRDLQWFNRQVSQERKKYKIERLDDLKEELASLEKELSQLEKRRSELLSVLKDKDSYGKFKHYQKSLAKIGEEIARLEEKLENLDKAGELEIQITELNEVIKTKADAIRLLITRSNDFYKTIRRLFNRIIQGVINVPAILSISQNKEGNIVFHADIQDPAKMEVTAEGYGTTYTKLLCIAFDLAVLGTYHDRSFHRFVYHDGALEGLDNRKKINFLETVRNLCKEYDLQYILTIIDSDIPYDDVGKKVEFPDEEIVLRLHDRDDSGRLFGIGF